MSDYLSEDLVAEILTRLPPKSLLRFRSLSKSLSSHIGSHDFIRKHTLQSPQKVLFRHKSYKNNHVIEDFITLHSQDQLPLSPKHGYKGIAAIEFLKGDFDIVGSCNGILCLLNDMIGYTLWNPSIRRKLTITKHPCWRHDFTITSTGFGFDPTVDDYKIVWIYCGKYGGVKKSFVYTMNTGTWLEIASPSSPFTCVTSSPFTCVTASLVGCFVNGALHWVVEYITNAASHCYILTFDLSSNIFGTIALPEPSWEAIRLTIINGSLAVFMSEGGGRKSIRVMRRDCNNTPFWSLVYSFDRNLSWKVMQLPTNGDLLIHSLYDQGLWVLHPKTHEQSKLVEINDSSFKDQMEMFVETLELLDSGTAYDLEDHPSFL